MVALNKIYTRTGDKGETGLATGERRPKDDPRVEATGAVDEANSAVGVARIETRRDPALAGLDAMLEAIQNDLFDLGADLSTPEGGAKAITWTPLRIVAAQPARLEREIDALNAELEPLRSFVLPAGEPAAAHLHLARALTRRAERAMVSLARAPGEIVSTEALAYVNRLSDFLFVAARWVNLKGAGDVLWKPGKNG
jgi:cob(I)alamin adenosyltransferase